jgi:hypothetical protein
MEALSSALFKKYLQPENASIKQKMTDTAMVI